MERARGIKYYYAIKQNKQQSCVSFSLLMLPTKRVLLLAAESSSMRNAISTLGIFLENRTETRYGVAGQRRAGLFNCRRSVYTAV